MPKHKKIGIERQKKYEDSVVEHSQRWVESDGKQAVHHYCDRPRKNTSQAINLPAVGCELAEVDHTTDHGEHEHVHPLESFPDFGKFLKEVGVILLFGRGAPAHVDAKHVRADG